MSIDISDVIIKFDCENCKTEISETVGNIRSNNKIRCPKCYHVAIVDISEMD